MTGNMTLVAGIVDSEDVVLGGDGLLLCRGTPFSNQYLKSAALNHDLAVAFSGDVWWASYVLCRLFGHLEWRDDRNICERWENTPGTSNLTMEIAHGIVGSSIRSLLADEKFACAGREGLGIMLAGRFNGKPHLCVWGWDVESNKIGYREGDFGHLSIGIARPSLEVNQEYEKRLTCGSQEAESAIVQAIRGVEEHTAAQVNRNICTRRLGNGEHFAKRWWIDTVVPSSWPAPSSSTYPVVQCDFSTRWNYRCSTIRPQKACGEELARG